jgi:hypothetical protein
MYENVLELMIRSNLFNSTNMLLSQSLSE